MNKPAILAAATIGLLFWLAPTIGQATDEVIVDGETLFGWCVQEKPHPEQDPIGKYCYGFLAGFISGHGAEKSSFDSRFCPRDHLSVGALRSVVASWLKDNIDKWDQNAYRLVGRALSETFPCDQAQKKP